MKLSDDFTRHQKYSDLGRWFTTRFVRDVAMQFKPGTRVLDAGAGECAYKSFFAHCAYRAVDLAIGDTNWNYMNLDYIAELTRLPFADGTFDAVLFTQVLEHLPRPAESLSELYRVLRDGGKLYLTVPMAQAEHQVPYDFFRYTSYGLKFLLGEAGFAECDVQPFGGMLARWAYELPRAMSLFPGTGVMQMRLSPWGLALLPLRMLVYGVIRVVQPLLLSLDRFDSVRSDPFGWAAVATKQMAPAKR